LAFATSKHRDQRRKDVDATPYINHPIAIAKILVDTGRTNDTEILCAALLHDTIEDTETSAEELAQAFGPTISAIIQEVTDDKSLKKHVRKQTQVDHAPHLTTKAKTVNLADKISNLSDVTSSPPPECGLK
jgi:guanosine-3',5'-bis(diphosphate) 3'-pyrophosphohydrolase